MNILILCTYPVKNPRHGGQLRVSNIAERYRLASHHVEVVGVLGSENYEHEDGFLPYPGYHLLGKYINNPFLMEDYAIARWLSEDEQAYRKLASLIKSVPDIVHVEQPWLFNFAIKYVKTHAPSAKIVYSSHNIECDLKYQILLSFFDTAIAAQHAEAVKQVELAAIRNADAVVCVSKNDELWIRRYTDRPIVLAPNGVAPWSSAPDSIKDVEKITSGSKYALYCASAHPPNITGFFSMFSGGFGSLKPDERLVIAGEAGLSILGDVRLRQSAKLAERIIVTGTVNQSMLAALLDHAHCIVLPLTQGGGTNLKTAEALWSGKHIVATSIALRGFENFINSEGIQVADDPPAFKRALRRAMESAPLRLSEADIQSRRSVLWESTLLPLDGLIKELSEVAKI